MKHIEFQWRNHHEVPILGQGWLPDGAARGAVCLVHGIGEHVGRYAHVAEAFNAAGYALLAHDICGHGCSGGAKGHIESYADLLHDITHLLEETAQRYPALPHFLYGHSLGGNLVLNYALRNRPKLAGVIATGPQLRLAFEPPASKVFMARVMSRVYPAYSQATGLETAALSRDPEVVRAYENDPLVHDRISTRLYIEAIVEAAQWALDHAGEFSLPLLLMHGGADRLTSPEGSRAFAAKVRGDCTLKIWDGLYHEIHNEPEKDQVIGFMVNWLNRHAGAG